MDKLVISNDVCECGRKLSKITDIQGRIADFILKEDGTQLNFSLFYSILDNIDKDGSKVAQYRVEQRKMNFRFYIVKAKSWDDKYLDVITTKMKETIGDNITIDFKFVDEIPRGKSGKLRDFVRIE